MREERPPSYSLSYRRCPMISDTVPILVKTKEEVANLPSNKPFKFFCLKCGKEVTIKAAGKRATKGSSGHCVSCSTSMRKKKHTDDYIEVTDPKQFDGMVRHQRFIITCKRCGKKQKHEQFDSRRLPTLLKFLCTKCAHADPMIGNKNGYKEDTHVETLIASPDQFNLMVNKRPYKYYCKRCGTLCHVKSYDPRKIVSNKQMLCNACSRFKYTYNGVSLDSSWELAVWIYAKDHNIPIEREPVVFEFTFDGKRHTVTPDFRLNGKLIEIKGSHLFKKDEKGIPVSTNPYTRSKNDGPKFTERDIAIRRSYTSAKFLCEAMNGVEFWGEKECKPFIEYVESTYGKSYLLQFRVK